MEQGMLRAVQRRETKGGEGQQKGNAGKASGLRSELRGMDFASAQARLAPPEEPGPAPLASGAAQAGAEGGVAAAREEEAPRSFGHWLQLVLNRVLGGSGLLDRPLQVDGVIGARTRAAIKAFQRGVPSLAPAEKGVPVDGTIGPVTLGALERVAGEVNPFGRKSAPAPVAAQAQAQAPEAAPEAAPDVGKSGAQAREAAPAPTGPTEVAERAAAEPERAPPAGGREQEMPIGPPPEVVVKVQAELQAEQQTASQGDAKAPAPKGDLAAMLRERLEAARLEMGQIKEKEWFTPPPFMRQDLVKAFEAKLELNKTAAGSGKPAGVWFAKDQHSLDRLNAFATTVQLDYEKTAVDKGYQWCGSFIAQHYGMTGKFEFISDKKRKQANKATADGNTYLASTSKSYDFFNYAGEWNGALIRDLSVPNDAPIAERYQPIVPFHQQNGGARAWFPIDKWKSDPQSVLIPGMVLFVKGTDKYGKHMIFVDRLEEDGRGGWVVHTVEGNAPGAGAALGKYAIGADGKTEIRAVARPSPLDFDPRLTMMDKDLFEQRLREESTA